MGLATDGSVVHAHCMLDTQGYKHTFIICNTYCSSHSNNGYTNSPHCNVHYVHCYGPLGPKHVERVRTCNFLNKSYSCLTVFLTFWRPNYFFLNLAHPVYNMWIIQEPNTLELWNNTFWRGKNGEYIPCLKYSVPIFAEYIYKMQLVEVSGAVRPL